MNINKASIVLGTFSIVLLLSVGLFFTMGGIVNTESSIPPGLYRKVDKPLAIGKMVVLCPADLPVFQQARALGLIQGGSCPGNFATQMLKIAGKRKDIVTINDKGIYINNVLIPQSNPSLSRKDSNSLTMTPLVDYELKENEVVLISEATHEPFDSRYFGPVTVEQIDSVITPIF